MVHQINAGYLRARSVIGLAAGRLLTEATDVNGARPVALVNERFVRARLRGAAPLGQTCPAASTE